MAEIVLRLKVAGQADIQQALAGLGQQSQVVAQTVERGSNAFARSRMIMVELGHAMAGTAAVAALFARSNPELQRTLEVISLTSSGLGTSLRALAAAMRVVISTIGWQITVLAAAAAAVAFLIAHWDQARNAITRAVHAIGEVIVRVFGGIKEVFAGFAQVMLGALSGNFDMVEAGVRRMQEGFSQVKVVLGEVGQAAIKFGKEGLQWLQHQFTATTQKTYDLAEALKGLSISAVIAWEQMGARWAAMSDSIAMNYRDLIRVVSSLTDGLTDAVIAGLEQMGKRWEAMGNSIAMNFPEHLLSIQAANEAIQRSAELAGREWREMLAAIDPTPMKKEAEDVAFDMGKAFGDAIGHIGADFLSLENIAKRVFNNILNEALGQLGKLVANGTDLFSALSQVLSNLGKGFGIGGGGGTLGGIGGIAGTLLGGPVGGLLGGLLGGIVRCQEGGIVTRPVMMGRVLAGEAGPEAIIPLSSPSAKAMLAGVGGHTFNVTFTGPFMGNAIEARQFARKMMEHIRQEAGRR